MAATKSTSRKNTAKKATAPIRETVEEVVSTAPVETVEAQEPVPAPAPEPEVWVEPKKKILFVASEAAPFIATGGLAEVIGSLSKAIAKDENYDVRVIIPLSQDIKKE